MRRFSSLFEILKFPLKILFLAYVMLGIGSLMQNDNFAIFYTITNPVLILTSEFMIRMGIFIISNFPLIVIIKLAARRTNSSVPILTGVVGYVVYLIATMILADSSLPSSAFSNILNINFVATNLPSVVTGIRYPIQTGLIAAFVVGGCTRYSYKQSRKNKYGLFGFIDRDVVALVLNIICCVFAGIAVALVWPYIFEVLQSVMNFIAGDISNPMSMFLYGVLDRLFSILNMGNLIKEPFWYGVAGGTWVNIAGESISGDVSVWSAMMAQGVNPIGFGRLITPYYVLNLFVSPAIILGMFSLYTDSKERSRMIPFVVLAIILSILTGSLIPLEMMLLFLCPLLLLFHLLFTGAIFGILQSFGATLGFSFSGNTTMAMPGTLFDYAIHFRNPELVDSISTIAMVGLVFFVIYFITTRIFFKYLAFDIFQTGEMKKMLSTFKVAVGGIENVKGVQATPFKIIVDVYDASVVDRETLLQIGAARVTENKEGFHLICGKNSLIICRNIKKAIKEATR